KLFVKNFPWMKGVSGLFHGLTSILHDTVDLSKNVHSHSLAYAFLVFDGDGRIRIGRRDGQTSLFEQRDMLFHAAARPGQAILDGAARASEPVEVRRIEPEEGGVRRGLDDERILQVNHAPPPDVSSQKRYPAVSDPRVLSAHSPACHCDEQSDEAISRPRLPRSLRSLTMTRAALAMTQVAARIVSLRGVRPRSNPEVRDCRAALA